MASSSCRVLQFHRGLVGLILLLTLCCVPTHAVGASRRWQLSSPTTPRHTKQHQSFIARRSGSSFSSRLPTLRGGYGSRRSSNLESNVHAVVKVLAGACQTVLPPIVTVVTAICDFYRALPIDAVIAQAGLVYCFAGGCYPTLLAAVSAAQQCGWHVLVQALVDLTTQAKEAIHAAFEKKGNANSYKEIVTQKTMIVLATVDPVKINTAISAIYTSWLGISSVLERDFARTISLSMTISDYLEPFTFKLLGPALRLAIPEDYHAWVPALTGWTCKFLAMQVAWRIERILSAGSSAVMGGLMFSRACLRMMRNQNNPLRGLVGKHDDDTLADEILGLAVAGLGFYSQIGSGFQLRIPFPLNLVTWPFGVAENWIQWQITKRS